jgi:hypothetical protein
MAGSVRAAEGTRTNDRVNTERIFKHDPSLADLPFDEPNAERWAQLFRELADGYKRGTLNRRTFKRAPRHEPKSRRRASSTAPGTPTFDADESD